MSSSPFAERIGPNWRSLGEKLLALKWTSLYELAILSFIVVVVVKIKGKPLCQYQG